MSEEIKENPPTLQLLPGNDTPSREGSDILVDEEDSLYFEPTMQLKVKERHDEI